MLPLSVARSLSLATVAPSEADLALAVAEGLIRGSAPQYVCLDPKRTLCPKVAAHLGTKLLNMSLPSDARWLFEGPSYIREIYETLKIANGGCDGEGPNSKGKATTTLIPSNGEDGLHDNPCVLRNGAVIAYVEGAFEYRPVSTSIRDEGWTHGFFMQPHNEEYFMERDRAAKEKRKIEPDAFSTMDMCLPRGKVPEATHFGPYVDCMQTKAQSDVGISTFASLLSNDALLTIVVPWQMPLPKDEISDPDVPWHLLAPSVKHTAPYFTRTRVSSIDCRAKEVPMPVQDLSSVGKSRDLSTAEENFADARDPGFLDHQCIAVCAGGNLSNYEVTDCYPGSIMWLANDLVQVAGRLAKGAAAS
jgi:hypothetical protein